MHGGKGKWESISGDATAASGLADRKAVPWDLGLVFTPGFDFTKSILESPVSTDDRERDLLSRPGPW